VNRATGLKFDELLPGYHIYGTDIVQQCLAGQWEALIVNAPAVHNSVPVVALDRSFEAAYEYLRKKWRRILPIDTCVLPITRWGWPLKKHQWRQWMRGTQNREVNRSERGETLARRLGYE
jgi:hypothetical protein